jgi:hypothetical protein
MANTGLPQAHWGTEYQKPEGHKDDLDKAPLSWLSGYAALDMAGVLAFGGRKYDRHNWRAGIAWSRVLDAALRHLTAWNGGQDRDDESGLPHLAHAACCIMFLQEYAQSHPELDDRYKPK